MKLFLRALLFFIGVVVLQSTLTIFLVTGIVTKNNEVDARLALKTEAATVYENYNSWVRILWKTIVRISKDEKLKTHGNNYRGSFSNRILKDWYEELLVLSGMDFIVIRNNKGISDEYSLSGNISIPYKKLEGLKSEKDYPYIRLREIDDSIYLVGFIKPDNPDGFEIYLLKHIDEKFYKQIPMQEQSIIFLTTSSKVQSGTLFDKDIFIGLINKRFLDVPYKEVYNLELEEGNYNAAFQNLGKLQKNTGEEDLILVLLLSNEPYLSILSRINKTLLSVSLIVSLFSILLSFYFSGKITRPISKLIYAMNGIREGNLNVQIDHKSGSEVGTLFQGFNEMTLRLNENKQSMEKFINEITFLKDYNEKIIYSLRAGIVILNSELFIEKVNGFFLDCFQLEQGDVLGNNIEEMAIEVIDKSIVDNIRDIINGNKSAMSEIRRVESFVYEIKLYTLFAISSNEDRKCVLEIDDVSRKFELEGKIFQAEKLASLSMLSAGVSHEINNPLSSILTNVQNLLAGEYDEETGIALNWIEQETRRIAKIVSELLDFSASEPDKDEGVKINVCITDVLRLINYGLEKDKRIEIIPDFEDNLPLALISDKELKQVIINLVQNSIYAIDGEGKIFIKTSIHQKMDKVVIEIIDTGSGVNEELIPHIFDPFFTTKENGKGTGLGLSIVYGIINKNSGTIDVISKKGSGTKFVIRIPVYSNLN